MSELPTRLLQETLRAGLTPGSSSGCIDAETLAAWSDGTLSTRDRDAAESHAAGCARCQALLAAMVRSTPAAPSRTWWRPSVFGWLAPLAAAAVAIVVWINVPSSPPPSPVAAPAASPTAARSTSIPTPNAAEKKEAPGSSPSETADARADAKIDERAKLRAVQPPATVPHREELDERRTTASASAPSVPRQAEPKAAPSGLRDAAAAPPAPVPQLPRAVPAPASPLAETARSSAANVSAGAAPAQTANNASAQAAGPPGFSARMAKAAVVPTEVVSPDPEVRWRFASSSVSRSIDGGATWQPQSTGYVAPLTAGSAPSPTTCWLVGVGGTVLRSTDGNTWQRLLFPETVDLTSIRAIDAVNATVTAADGRVFTTDDGGKTWRTKE